MGTGGASCAGGLCACVGGGGASRAGDVRVCVGGVGGFSVGRGGISSSCTQGQSSVCACVCVCTSSSSSSGRVVGGGGGGGSRSGGESFIRRNIPGPALVLSGFTGAVAMETTLHACITII